jgi:hypothetical protein
MKKALTMQEGVGASRVMAADAIITTGLPSESQSDQDPYARR